MKKLQQHKLPRTVNAKSGDLLICTIQDGEIEYSWKTEIKQNQEIDTIIFFEATDFLGVDGFGVVFGKEK